MAPKLSAFPEVTLEANGIPLPPALLQSLSRVYVAQRLSQPSQCELTFSEAAQTLSIDMQLAPGTDLRVTAGGITNVLFSGQVTSVEYVYGPSNQRDIRIRAYDKLHSLRKRQNIRTFAQVTLASLARELTADLSITVDAVEAGPIYQWLIQHRQSDWDMLRELAERCGLYLTLREDTLHLLTLEGVGDAVDLTLGESLLEARIEANGDSACRMVSAEGWYPMRAERCEGVATMARSGRRVSAEVPPDRLGGNVQRTLVDQSAQDDSQARAIAQAELDRRTAREVTLWGMVNGDPALRPGTPIEVRGVAPTVAGRYLLTEVIHVIDAAIGFQSEISTVVPLLQERPQGTTATLGVVSQINDPDGLGRVRVRLSTYNDIETDWMGVLTPGAGSGKGLIALPDVGDQVLVLLA